jgi:K+-transporting ATPase ATPase C chain
VALELSETIMAHVRAMAWLLGLTVLLVCVLYPLCLWLVGQGLFRDRANGSLIVDDKGEVRGSRLIGQKFDHPRYFRSRPSATADHEYNAAASGGSNLAASNPLLRDRVARLLGKIARFNDGRPVGPEVQDWFVDHPDVLARWAKENPTLAARWVNDDNKKATVAWLKGHPELVAKTVDLDRIEKETTEKVPDDLAVAFFVRFAESHPAHWPITIDNVLGAQRVTKVDPNKSDTNVGDLQEVLFDAWLTANPKRGGEIKPVPADLVLASGSGLDPHITWRSALYQLDGVVATRADESKRKESEVKQRILDILDKHAHRPLFVLGERLVNVVEVNHELDREFGVK